MDVETFLEKNPRKCNQPDEQRTQGFGFGKGANDRLN